MLECRGVTKSFGGLVAVNRVSLHVHEKEVVGLIGPNGSGKTTLFNIINGFYKPDSGCVEFQGKNISGLKPHEICRLGIGRTFQLVKPFMKMTALENVVTAALYGKGKSISMSDARQKALHWLEFVGLYDKRHVATQDLNFTDLRMLELARALATEPKLLLLDEIMAGLNPAETSRALKLLKDVLEVGISIFWIEHIMKAIMTLSHRVIVLHSGEKIAEGKPTTISKNEKVIKAYLGETYVKFK